MHLVAGACVHHAFDKVVNRSARKHSDGVDGPSRRGAESAGLLAYCTTPADFWHPPDQFVGPVLRWASSGTGADALGHSCR